MKREKKILSLRLPGRYVRVWGKRKGHFVMLSTGFSTAGKRGSDERSTTKGKKIPPKTHNDDPMAEGKTPEMVTLGGTEYKPLADGHYDVVILGTALKCLPQGFSRPSGRKRSVGTGLIPPPHPTPRHSSLIWRGAGTSPFFRALPPAAATHTRAHTQLLSLYPVLPLILL